MAWGRDASLVAGSSTFECPASVALIDFIGYTRTGEFVGNSKMITTMEWISALKSETCIQSDYGIATLLDVCKTTISKYRQNKSHLDDFIAQKVADSLKIPAEFLVVSAHYERAKSDEERAVWLSLWQAIDGPQVEENIRKKLNDKVMQPAIKISRIAA